MDITIKPSIWRRLSTPCGLLCLVAAMCFIIEILIIDRKFGLFTGGFGQSRIVDTPQEYLMMLPGAGAFHVLLFFLIWKLLTFLHRNRPKNLVLRYNILTLGGGLFLGALAAEFELLSMFSDSITFSLIKSLGGGSLLDATLYGILHGGWGSVLVGIAPIFYGFGLWYFMKKDPKTGRSHLPKVPWKPAGVLAAVGTAFMLLVDHSTMYRYANMKFLAFGGFNSALETATDFDRDGYSWFSYLDDKHPFDGTRHPFALDIPNNGIDEDEVGGDFKLANLPAPMATPKFTGRKPHVIHIVFESARYDMLGKRINGKPVVPNLEALAAAGSDRRAYSPLGFTTGSLKAMFSGRIEPPKGTGSLFHDFKANGYRVSVYSGQAERFGDIAETLGMQKAADNFIDAEKLKNERAYGFASLASLKLDEQVLLREFEENLGDPKHWTTPNYIYFNFQSAHFPYSHTGMKNLLEPNPIPRGAIKASQRDWLQRTYWNSLAYADMTLGGLVADLKRLGVWENTVLLVTGDHGEDLFEDGFLGHGHIISSRQYSTHMVTNIPGYGGGPIGLVDYRALIHALIEGKPFAPRTEPLLLHIGPLDTPSAIGMVEPSGRMMVYSLDKREVQTDENTLFTDLDRIEGANKKRLDTLINLWARERWRRHVSEREGRAGAKQ